mgnify:CR=1 FL=1
MSMRNRILLAVLGVALMPLNLWLSLLGQAYVRGWPVWIAFVAGILLVFLAISGGNFHHDQPDNSKTT